MSKKLIRSVPSQRSSTPSPDHQFLAIPQLQASALSWVLPLYVMIPMATSVRLQMASGRWLEFLKER